MCNTFYMVIVALFGNYTYNSTAWLRLTSIETNARQNHIVFLLFMFNV